MQTFKKLIFLFVLIFLIPIYGGCKSMQHKKETIKKEVITEKPSFKPKDGFVPNEETAIKIAEAIWIAIYGKEQIESEKPFKATLKNDVWIVTGTLPEGHLGGTAIAEIRKEDGRILRVIHEQ